MAGKGSRPRPYSVPLETFDNNFDAIFGKKDKKEPADKETKKTEENKKGA